MPDISVITAVVRGLRRECTYHFAVKRFASPLHPACHPRLDPNHGKCPIIPFPAPTETFGNPSRQFPFHPFSPDDVVVVDAVVVAVAVAVVVAAVVSPVPTNRPLHPTTSPPVYPAD
jgi:hypothetical protein